MTTATQPTIADAKRFSKQMIPVVNELLTTRLIAERVKKQIDAACSQILAAGSFRYSDHWYEDGMTDLPADRILREVQDTYLMDDEQAKQYYKLRADYIEQAGWKVERDFCPASMAESKCIRLEQQILDAMADMMHCENMRHVYGENRDKALNLAISLVTNVSTYRKPVLPREWLGKAL